MSKKEQSADGPKSLSELLAYIASNKPVESGLEMPATRPLDEVATAKSAEAPKPLPDKRQEPAQLDYFRDLWAGVNASLQLKQSQARVPGNAGPLNSSSLVHRSLLLMRDLSPGYLQHFLAHAEALSWMGQLSEPSTPGASGQPKESVRKSSARKSTRSR